MQVPDVSVTCGKEPVQRLAKFVRAMMLLLKFPVHPDKPFDGPSHQWDAARSGHDVGYINIDGTHCRHTGPTGAAVYSATVSSGTLPLIGDLFPIQMPAYNQAREIGWPAARKVRGCVWWVEGARAGRPRWRSERERAGPLLARTAAANSRLLTPPHLHAPPPTCQFVLALVHNAAKYGLDSLCLATAAGYTDVLKALRQLCKDGQLRLVYWHTDVVSRPLLY